MTWMGKSLSYSNLGEIVEARRLLRVQILVSKQLLWGITCNIISWKALSTTYTMDRISVKLPSPYCL